MLHVVVMLVAIAADDITKSSDDARLSLPLCAVWCKSERRTADWPTCTQLT